MLQGLLLAIERVYAGEVWVNRMMMGKLLESMSASAGKGANADPEAAKIASLTPREREIVGAIDQGLLVLVAVEPEDSREQADKLLHKLLNYRVFSDEQA